METTKRAEMAVFATVLVDLLGFGIVIPILPLYAKDLAANPSRWMESVNSVFRFQSPEAFWVGLVFVSFSVMQFLATPFLGRVSDLVGRRPVLFVSLVGSCAGYVLLATTNRLEWVLAARMLSGVMGGNVSVAQAAMADISPKEHRSKALGLIGAAFGLGFVLGPAMAGLLSGSSLGRLVHDSLGWHLPFMVAALLSILAALLVLLWLPETLPAESRERARRIESRGHALLRAIGRPGMLQILAICFLAMSGFSMMEGTYSMLGNSRFGLGQREVGWLFAFAGIIIVAYQGGLVRIVSRTISERSAVWIGLVFMTVAMPFTALAPWMWPFVLVMVPLAMGNSMNNTATFALASQLTPADEQGGLFGVMSATQGVGRIVGPAVGNIVFAEWGYVAAYWVAAATVAAALVIAATIPKRST